MTDQHLANTINFLRVRGVHTPAEVKSDPIAKAEVETACVAPETQAKLAELVNEQRKREESKEQARQAACVVVCP